MKSLVALSALVALTTARVAAASYVASLPPAPGVASSPPALARERALVIWDAAAKREHLVLDLELAHSEKKLGLLIPVPTAPELVALDKSPFAALGAELPFDRTRTSLLFTGQGWKNAQKPPAGIDLYEEQRIGAFTATMLAARDEAALTRWLFDHGLGGEGSPALASYRARYAALGFHFVALRYEPASPPEPGMISRTLRLSFDTPAPFYPYFEGTPATEPHRSASLWLVTRSEALLPVAAHGSTWARPFAEGGRYRVGRFVVERALGEVSALLPAGAELSVQVFEDRKTSRDDFSDVVWVEETEVAADVDRRDLAAILDPRLSDTPPPPPVAAPSAVVPTTPVSVTASRCSAAPGRSGLSPWLAIAIALGARRRWLASLIALGCRREQAPPPPPAPAPSTTVAPPFEPAERMREVHAIVRGAIPPGGIPVLAQDPGAPWELPRRPSIKLDAVAEGGLTRDAVLRTVRSTAARFRACYDLGLRTVPTLSGRVTAFVTVTSTGQTEKTRVKDDLPHAGTVACMTSVFQSLSYPASNPPAPASATIELELSR